MVVEKRLYTVEEFERILALPENTERLLELVDGEIVEKVPTEQHGMIAVNAATALRNFTRTEKLGRVTVEARHRVPDDRHNDRLPDVAFTHADRALPLVERGAVPQIPDLCIEIQSPTDSPKTMRDKAAYYLANGARLVWLVYPKKRMVEALYPDGEFDIYDDEDTLTGGEILPGFTLPVRDLFEE